MKLYTKLNLLLIIAGLTSTDCLPKKKICRNGRCNVTRQTPQCNKSQCNTPHCKNQQCAIKSQPAAPQSPPAESEKLVDVLAQAATYKYTQTGTIHVFHGSPADFQSEINRSEFVLVDFSASWCHPCKILHETLTQLAPTKNIIILKIDINEHPALTDLFQIAGMPTLILFQNGQEIKRIVGNQSRKFLENWIPG